MKSYYEQDGIVIYHGDCRDVLWSVDGRSDLLLTDPPYGKGYAERTISAHTREAWDSQPVSIWVLLGLMAQTTYQVIWGGFYYAIPLARCWLVWHKPDAVPTMGDCELAWTNFNKPCQHITHSIAATNGERVGHPTQKPEAVMRWCIQQAPEANTILDPFMGSGTTLVAAKRLGRKAIGIEMEEKYCEIAAKRLAQGALDLFPSPSIEDAVAGNVE